MGRLFWKLFFAFWLTLLLTGLAVATALNFQRQHEARDDPPALAGGPAAMMILDSASSVLEHGGTDALHELMRKWSKRPFASQLYAVDARGVDLLGREVPAEIYEEALEFADKRGRRQPARRVESKDGAYLLFVPVSERGMGGRHRGPPPLLPPAMLMLLAGIAGSIVFAALLAWYLSRPIRHLRWAFDNAAQGKLDVRVQSRIGNRRDEIADLGSHFDRMAQRLQTLLEGQQRLLHDVSHELRSPLARLQAAIGLARQNRARTEAMLERIEQESERLDRLVGELLALSRLDTQTDGSRVEEADIAELVEDIAKDARFEAQANGRDLQFSSQSSCIAIVQVDALQRAIENVVRNAVKYTDEDTMVEVTLEREQPSGAIVIEVCDRGPGVPDSELKKIFEPFYRGDRARGVSGFGLGLAIAERAVRANGGTICAVNREGGGFCVEIRLPSHSSARTAL